MCGSDVFLQKGGFGPGIALPVVPGHEAAGVVDALGEGVTGVAAGDQVALYYITHAAWRPVGRARAAQYPPDVIRMGLDVDGAFAEYVLRPTAALIRPRAPVPPAILAVLTDAVAAPLHGLKRVARLQRRRDAGRAGRRRARLQRGPAGQGDGRTVIAVTRSEAKLRLARELGADEVDRRRRWRPRPAARQGADRRLRGGRGHPVRRAMRAWTSRPSPWVAPAAG